MKITIYHNPRCSKSRETLALIEDAGISPEIVRYIDSPPSADRIRTLAGRLGVGVAELLRQGDALVADADDLPDLDDDAALAAWIERNPAALQRPIVTDEETGSAVIGRPPGNVRTLLEP